MYEILCNSVWSYVYGDRNAIATIQPYLKTDLNLKSMHAYEGSALIHLRFYL